MEYKTIAKELGNKGVVTKETSDALLMMAGYRNRMVHFYKEVTPLELYQIVKNNLSDIEQFIKEINAFLKQYSNYKS